MHQNFAIENIDIKIVFVYPTVWKNFGILNYRSFYENWTKPLVFDEDCDKNEIDLPLDHFQEMYSCFFLLHETLSWLVHEKSGWTQITFYNLV